MPIEARPASAAAVPHLQEAPLRDLIAANVVSKLIAVGCLSGFTLEARLGEQKAVLANSRGNVRMFASLDAVVTLIGRLGRYQFEVDASEYKPGRVRAAQPARSAAMLNGKLPKADQNK
jgi:hypothetical protein